MHVRVDKGTHRVDEKCLFCKLKDIHETCPTGNPPPPKDFECFGPWVLPEIIREWNYHRDHYTEPPAEPDWPLLIPEVSDITDTTSRLGVWPDEGDWQFDKWDPVAWDMTGYLFDKIQGAHWVRDPEVHEEHDWHHVLGPRENWIRNLLMVDRLPDRLAIQTPPSSIMVAYLNRLYAYYYPLLMDDDAPFIWLLTHGYPSYIDWPPAWHWSMGIRMLGSLASYIGSQTWGLMGAAAGTRYPDEDRVTTEDLRVPFIALEREHRLLFRPTVESYGPVEMDWVQFPGIIPFVPGADTNQLAWFTKHILELGYSTVALDAVNSIAHETFKGLPEAIATVLNAGAKHVMVYGPWPLHLPSKYVRTRNVSYIPCANHMDLTNRTPRFWRKKAKDGKKTSWRKPPSYRYVNLGEAATTEGIEICDCKPCQSARVSETDPRDIWRWGHLLKKGREWMMRAQKRPRGVKPPAENTVLRYQGPSYTVFRKCLHYPPETQWPGIEDIIPTLVFNETKMEVRFPDGVTGNAEDIRWTWWDEGHHWTYEYPQLED